MMAAKLHQELKDVVDHGELMKRFRKELTGLCNLYEIEMKPLTLERYLPVGRMMLECKALAFVSVSLLLDQQQLTKRIIRDEQKVRELSNLATDGMKLLGQEMVPVLDKTLTVAATTVRLMKQLSTAAELEELEVTRVNAVVPAFDLARVLRMNFGHGPVGSVTPDIIWEYASLINTSMVALQISGWCLPKTFRANRVPPSLDRVAIACCDENVGIVLNFAKRTIVAHMYEPMDKDQVQALVGEVAKTLDFPENYHFCSETLNGFEDVGLLHWLSEIVWGNGQRETTGLVELVRLQVALELLNQELIPAN